MRDLYANAIDALLAQECKPQVVRAIERGGDPRPLWSCLQESGFADTLVSEDEGGAGLTLADAFVIFERCGAHAVPLPFAETVVARALLGAAGLPESERPTGPVTFASARRHEDHLRCEAAASARTASHVIAHDGSDWLMLDVTTAEAHETTDAAGVALDASLHWAPAALRHAVTLRLPAAHDGLSPSVLQACVHAAQIAGAAGRVIEMTLAFANQRVQFGRVIGKFQAVQHHLAVMAEQVAAARMAAELGCLSDSWAPDPLRAAVAKGRASEAAVEVARLAHQVHGAIGFTEELDLQLFTRRLQAWRRAGGSESAWHLRSGAALVDGTGNVLDHACRLLQPPAPAAGTLACP